MTGARGAGRGGGGARRGALGKDEGTRPRGCRGHSTHARSASHCLSGVKELERGLSSLATQTLVLPAPVPCAVGILSPHHPSCPSQPPNTNPHLPVPPSLYPPHLPFTARTSVRKAQQMAHLQPVIKEIYDEHISHLKETDERPAYPYGDFAYYSKTVKGLSYKMHCRRPRGDEGAAEEVVLDENVLAEGKAQCTVICTVTCAGTNTPFLLPTSPRTPHAAQSSPLCRRPQQHPPGPPAPHRQCHCCITPKVARHTTMPHCDTTIGCTPRTSLLLGEEREHPPNR